MGRCWPIGPDILLRRTRRRAGDQVINTWSVPEWFAREALTLARRAGLSATRVFETLIQGSADSFALRHHGMRSMLPDEYPERAFSVEYALKDMQYLLDFAEQAHADLKGAKHAMAVLERAVAAGNGKKYFPVLVSPLDPHAARRGFCCPD